MSRHQHQHPQHQGEHHLRRGLGGLDRLVLVGSIGIVGLATGCADDPVREPIVVTEPGTVIEVDAGDEFAVVLESNATTGYAWTLERPVLEQVVRLVADEYVAPDTDPAGAGDLVGAGGRQELTFEAVGPGTAEISLWYVRSFDDPKEPAGRAAFSVVVAS